MTRWTLLLTSWFINFGVAPREQSGMRPIELPRELRLVFSVPPSAFIERYHDWLPEMMRDAAGAT